MNWLSSFFKFLSSLRKSLKQFFCSHPHWETMNGEDADYIEPPVPPANGAAYSKMMCVCKRCGKKQERCSHIEYGNEYKGSAGAF